MYKAHKKVNNLDSILKIMFLTLIAVAVAITLDGIEIIASEGSSESFEWSATKIQFTRQFFYSILVLIGLLLSFAFIRNRKKKKTPLE